MNEQVKILDGETERWVSIPELLKIIRAHKVPSQKKKKSIAGAVGSKHPEGCMCQTCFEEVMKKV